MNRVEHVGSFVRPEALLNTAMESTPNGLCIFDADLRVVVSNSHFAAMYGLTPAQTRPGTGLLEILDSRVAASCCPPNAAEYVADCLDKAGSRQTHHSVDELGNGNVIAVSRHPMLDGGWIEVHRDITDARLAEARGQQQGEQLGLVADLGQRDGAGGDEQGVQHAETPGPGGSWIDAKANVASPGRVRGACLRSCPRRHRRRRCAPWSADQVC